MKYQLVGDELFKRVDDRRPIYEVDLPANGVQVYALFVRTLAGCPDPGHEVVVTASGNSAPLILTDLKARWSAWTKAPWGKQVEASDPASHIQQHGEVVIEVLKEEPEKTEVERSPLVLLLVPQTALKGVEAQVRYLALLELVLRDPKTFEVSKNRCGPHGQKVEIGEAAIWISANAKAHFKEASKEADQSPA